jgi:hypothetical protein
MADFSPEDTLEIEADRQRRVTAAFRLGSEASPRASGPSSAGQLGAGLAIAIAVLLVLGVIALAQGTAGSGGASKSPAPIATPVKSPRQARLSRRLAR